MATSADVPGRVPVAINGHAFMAEPTIERTTVQVIRQQADTSPEAGEQTLSPLGLWRRSQESWHHGAGQPFLDGRQGDSPTDPHRFRSSKGIDPWTKGQISLLHPTMKIWSTTNTNLFLAAPADTAGIFHLYVADGNELYWNPVPFTEVNTLALQTGTGWTATNATIAVSGITFQLTATSAAAVSATSPIGTAGMPVDAFRKYGFAFASIYVSGGAAKIPTVRVNWYDAAGVFLSSSTLFTAASSDGSGSVIYGNATAPAGAAFASLTIAYTANWANGEIHRVSGTSLGPYKAVSPFPAPEQWAISNIQAGEAAQPVQAITTNGSYVWAALGTSGLHRTFAGGGAATANVPAAPGGGQISLCGWANGFLLAAGSSVTTTARNTLWLVNDPLGAPTLTVLKTHPDSNFKWEGIGPGRNCVYAWGNSGQMGEVYKILFDPNTGALSTAASFATYLPDGENINALQFYAGGIIMGTGNGLRIGTADGAGNIDYGPLIPTEWPVRALEPQDRYCWFGWTKYDSSNSGLGRIDLGFLTDTLTPAWASDLMTSDTSSGDVVGCVTFAPYGYLTSQLPAVRVFTVAGKGVYIEDPTWRVSAGELESGAVRFSTSEPKYAKTVDVMYHVSTLSSGFLEVDSKSDDGSYVALVGSTITSGGTAFAIGDDGEAFEVRIRLAPGFSVPLDIRTSLEVTRWTLKALPRPTTIDETFTIPIIMTSDSLTNQGDGTPYPIDVPAEIAYLKGLERSRAIIEMQVGEELVPDCYVVGSQFKPWRWSDGQKFLEGLYLLSVQTARG